jgi:hypothetical protein
MNKSINLQLETLEAIDAPMMLLDGPDMGLIIGGTITVTIVVGVVILT